MHTEETPKFSGSHSKPEAVSVLRAVLAQATTPRRPVSHYDDSDVSSFAYPSSTLLGGIHQWSWCDRLSLPLHGLMVSRYRGEGAFTFASKGQELHLHVNQVIKDL
jgi:hypothetical protein